MILSASRRTDIPCRYPEWFMNRLKAGYALARNPMNSRQLSRIPLTPDVIDGIVFWTKDAKNILPYLDALDAMGYAYYFQFTLTPYDRVLEPGLRDKPDIESTFLELSGRLGKERVVWRYDPIILNDALTAEYHRTQFERLCDRLSPYTDTVTVSFVDVYPKLKTPLVREIAADERAQLGEMIGAAAREHGLCATACCERDDLSPYGIERAACVDKARLEKLCRCPLDLTRDKNQRPGCGCCESVDIGAYVPVRTAACTATPTSAPARRRGGTTCTIRKASCLTAGQGRTKRLRSGKCGPTEWIKQPCFDAISAVHTQRRAGSDTGITHMQMTPPVRLLRRRTRMREMKHNQTGGFEGGVKYERLISGH